MDQELTYYLAKRYPRIFPQKKNENDFYWSFECNSGWFRLLNNSCFEMQNHIDHNNKQYERKSLYQSYIANNELENLPELIKIQHEKGIPLEVGKYCTQIVAKQVKEKFGTLRFYCEGGDSFCNGIISLAESMSFSICEECGEVGKHISKKGYFKVLCQKHASEGNISLFTDSDDKELKILMLGGYQEMKVIQTISDTEIIAENKQSLKVHAFKHINPQIEYWSGSILID